MPHAAPFVPEQGGGLQYAGDRGADLPQSQFWWSDLPIFHEIAGDAVRYCKLDTEDAVPQLAAAMRQIREAGKESIPESLCEAVVGRYKKERLAGGLKEF